MCKNVILQSRGVGVTSVALNREAKASPTHLNGVKDLKCFDMIRFFASLRMTGCHLSTFYESIKKILTKWNLFL
jgi:hypothetical protein